LATGRRKISCGARNSYFTYTGVHLATRRRLISCRAQKQLIHPHSGPFGHPTKENQLRGPETAIPPTQWSIWPPDKGKLAAGPRNSYFIYTGVHLATQQRKISCGDHIQLFNLHRGPFGHPTKENQLRGPETAISRTQGSIWPPNEENQLRGPETHISPTQGSIWPPDEEKSAARPRNSFFTYTRVHLAPDEGKSAVGPRNSYFTYTGVHLALR
jgi:hypothetical protein